MLENRRVRCLVAGLPVKKLLDHIRSLWMRLMELRDTPHAIAGGVAIGVFWGFTPLFGLKTLLSLVTAWLARCSKLAAVIAVSLHDVLVFFGPFILRIQYDIGFWILSNPHHLPPKIPLHKIKFGLSMDMLTKAGKWLTSMHDGWLPLLVGSLVIAIPASLISYFVAYFIMRRRSLPPLKPSA